MFTNTLPAAKLVDQPAYYGPHQHVDPAQEAAHPGHGGLVTEKIIILGLFYQQWDT